MSNNIKGGKSDKMSVADIAKKHGVSVEAIEKEIEIGMKVESEHTASKGKEREITMDHLVEDPVYYSDPVTGLIAKEKAAEKRREKINEEAKKYKTLAGIQEGDKKFLTNESFSEPDSATLYPKGWKEMDGTFMGPNGITQEKLDEISKLMSKDEVNPDDWRGMDSMRMGTSDIPSLDKAMDESTGESDFIVLEFEQDDVEPGHDDEELYKLK